MTRKRHLDDYEPLYDAIMEYIEQHYPEKPFNRFDLKPVADKFNASDIVLRTALTTLARKHFIKTKCKVRLQVKMPQVNQVSMFTLQPKSEREGFATGKKQHLRAPAESVASPNLLMLAMAGKLNKHGEITCSSK